MSDIVVGGRYRLERTLRSPHLVGALLTVRKISSHWAECELDKPELAHGRRLIAAPTSLAQVPADS